MHEINRMASSAVNELLSITKGHGLFGVSPERRLLLTGRLLQATGCAIEIHSGQQQLIRENVLITESNRQEMEKDVALSLADWLVASEPIAGARPMLLPGGSMEIAERSGLSLRHAVGLLEALYHVVYKKGDVTLELSRTSLGNKLRYRRKGFLEWNCGIVSTRSKSLPESVATALRGKPLSHLIQDDVLGDRIIRKVCQVSPEEGMLRVVTTDEGRRYTVG